MSRPDFVQVDTPSFSGVVPATVPAASAHSSPSPIAEETDESAGIHPPSTPWAIGATDGALAAMHLSRHSRGELPPSSTQSGAELVVATSPSPPPVGDSAGGAMIGAMGQATTLEALTAVNAKRSLFHERLLHPPSAAVESCLAAACEVMGFDIAEMWLRTGPKTHQLTNSHLRPSALDDSVRDEIVDVYYGEKSSERTHLLSPALCKRAKEANDIVWVTSATHSGAEALRVSISDVRTAVAVPVCHEASNTNITIIYFCIRRNMMRSAAVEFLVHMSLAAAVASVNNLADDGLVDKIPRVPKTSASDRILSQSEHVPTSRSEEKVNNFTRIRDMQSITGARLDLQWRDLHNVEYLTDGGNNWIHTAVLHGKPVVVKTLKPECQDLVLAINEIEGELAIHARLNHPNICGLLGAGSTSKGVRFVVLERLDGGTMSQMLGYDMRIRDRRRRFWRKKKLPYQDILKCAHSMANALAYMHGDAIPGCMLLHRDLKPDNIGFTLAGEVKIIDFGLARIIENSDPTTDERYEMSGETGSLRYMAPEVAKSLPYNHKADVYSFGIIFWELNACRKPYEGMSKEEFYVEVVHGGLRPEIHKKWPTELASLITACWSEDPNSRPTFSEIVLSLDQLLAREKGGGKVNKKAKGVLSGLIDRHSTWF